MALRSGRRPAAQPPWQRAPPAAAAERCQTYAELRAKRSADRVPRAPAPAQMARHERAALRHKQHRRRQRNDNFQPQLPLAPQTVALMLHAENARYAGAGAPALAAFPAELRPRIWAQLLQLESAQAVPVPTARRGGDAWERAEAMVARKFNPPAPSTSARQTGWTTAMRQTTATVASVLLVSPSAEGVGFLPTVASGFVGVFGRDTASAAAATLGYLATYGAGAQWFYTAPFAPFVLLDALDGVLATIDPQLHASLTAPPLSLGPPDYIWPAMRSLLLEVLPQPAWTELMDHLFQRPPSFLPALVLAFVRSNRGTIEKLRVAAPARTEHAVSLRLVPTAAAKPPKQQQQQQRDVSKWKGYPGSPRGLDQSLRMPVRKEPPARDPDEELDPAEVARQLFRRENDALDLVELLADAEMLREELGVTLGLETIEPICARAGVYIDHVGAAMSEAAARCSETYTQDVWEQCRQEQQLRVATPVRGPTEEYVVENSPRLSQQQTQREPAPLMDARVIDVDS